MAVYSRKDFENFINKEKIRKQKIKNRIIKIITLIFCVILVIGAVYLFSQDRNNFIFEDNCTDAINYAIEQFKTTEPKSHDDYPRLSYNYKTLPTHPSNNVVQDTENSNNNNMNGVVVLPNGDIIKEYNTNNNNNNTDKNTTNNTESKNNKGTNKNTNKTTDKEKEEKTYEYNYFIEIAGKGNLPGYNIVGGNYIHEIREQLCLAIKAYTTMPLASGEDTYRLNYHDERYDYVYFFLAGEVKKVDKAYLKQLDGVVGQNSYDIYNFWISLTENKSSKIAANLLNTMEEKYYVIITDLEDKAIGDVKVSFVSGSYIETVQATKNAVVLFDNVPLGKAELRIEKDGFISFPNEIVYKEYDKINVEINEEYKGKYISSPLRVKLQESSFAQCSFSFTNYIYEKGKDGKTVGEELISGNYTVKLTNKETKEEIERVIDFEGEDIYLCHYFEKLPKGIYDINVYPTADNLAMLEIENAYINQHGIGEGEYLTENSKFTFAFNTDETVNVTLDIADKTSYGLFDRKGNLKMYQLIKSKELNKEHLLEFMAVDVKSQNTILGIMEEKDGRLVGKVDLQQNRIYDFYISTVFGDILIYNDFKIKTSNCTFKQDITNKDIPDCYTSIYIKRNEDCIIKIENTSNSDQIFTLTKVDGEGNSYLLDNDKKISAGYYYLYIYNKDNQLKEMYVILISEKSNNFTINFR